MAKIVLPILGGKPADEPDWGGLGDAGWARGLTFLEYTAQSALRERLESAFRDLVVTPQISAFLAAGPARVRILALDELVTRPAALPIAWAERLCTASPQLWMRIFAAEASADLVQRYRPQSTQLPCFVFFGADRREFARLGSDTAPASSSADWVRVFCDSLGRDPARHLP